MAFWQAKFRLTATGQTTDYTPAGRTCVDDGGSQLGASRSYGILTAGQHSGTTAITVNAKTDTHTNETVVDKRTGLMWSRRESASVGATSNGQLEWDDTAGSDEDVFEYCDQANLASLAGYTDWRVPNREELYSIITTETGEPFLDVTAWPSVLQGVGFWSSSTVEGVSANSYATHTDGTMVGVVKTTSVRRVILVRGI